MTQRNFWYRNLSVPERTNRLSATCHMTMEGKKRFSSDDFRACNLEKFLDDDLSHSIGGLFARLNGASHCTS